MKKLITTMMLLLTVLTVNATTLTEATNSINDLEITSTGYLGFHSANGSRIYFYDIETKQHFDTVFDAGRSARALASECDVYWDRELCTIFNIKAAIIIDGDEIKLQVYEIEAVPQ